MMAEDLSVAEDDNVLCCLYCTECISDLEDIREHLCFEDFDESMHQILFSLNGEGVKFLSYDFTTNVESTFVATTDEDCTNQEEEEQEEEQEAEEEQEDKDGIFTVGMEERLITIVQKYKPLYDHRIKVTERKKIKKSEIWKKVCIEFADSRVDAKRLALKWKYLRDNYIKAYSKYRLDIIQTKKSGSAYQEVKKPGFRHFELMSFIKDIVDSKMKPISSVSSQRRPKASAKNANNVHRPSASPHSQVAQTKSSSPVTPQMSSSSVTPRMSSSSVSPQFSSSPVSPRSLSSSAEDITDAPSEQAVKKNSKQLKRKADSLESKILEFLTTEVVDDYSTKSSLRSFMEGHEKIIEKFPFFLQRKFRTKITKLVNKLEEEYEAYCQSEKNDNQNEKNDNE